MRVNTCFTKWIRLTKVERKNTSRELKWLGRDGNLRIFTFLKCLDWYNLFGDSCYPEITDNYQVFLNIYNIVGWDSMGPKVMMIFFSSLETKLNKTVLMTECCTNIFCCLPCSWKLKSTDRTEMKCITATCFLWWELHIRCQCNSRQFFCHLRL